MSLIGLNDFLSLLGSFNPDDPINIAGEIAGGAALIPRIVAANHHTAEVAFGLGIDTVIYETLPAATSSQSQPD